MKSAPPPVEPQELFWFTVPAAWAWFWAWLFSFAGEGWMAIPGVLTVLGGFLSLMYFAAVKSGLWEHL